MEYTITDCLELVTIQIYNLHPSILFLAFFERICSSAIYAYNILYFCIQCMLIVYLFKSGEIESPSFAVCIGA